MTGDLPILDPPHTDIPSDIKDRKVSQMLVNNMMNWSSNCIFINKTSNLIFIYV